MNKLYEWPLLTHHGCSLSTPGFLYSRVKNDNREGCEVSRWNSPIMQHARDPSYWCRPPIYGFTSVCVYMCVERYIYITHVHYNAYTLSAFMSTPIFIYVYTSIHLSTPLFIFGYTYMDIYIYIFTVFLNAVTIFINTIYLGICV